MTGKPPRVSVIVRTYNEEAWVDHCLRMVFRQDYPDIEVIVVDNRSTDHTLEIVRRHPVAEVVTIDDYLPGLSLNLGIRRASGAYIACLSAHCIPRDTGWLSALVRNLEEDPVAAGVYGRQLPLAFSPAFDKRDLLTVFGQDRRVQVKDYFFHNANSLLRRAVWEAFPFDEAASNIEDRLWGKAVVAAGYRLIYEPEAAVYHHHGINQDGDYTRAQGVSRLLDQLEQDLVADLPESLRPENCHVAAVIPVLGAPRELQGGDLLGEVLRQVQRSRYVRQTYVFGDHPQTRRVAEAAGAIWLERPPALTDRGRTLDEVLRHVLERIEAGGAFPETLLYANYLCPFRPPGLFDELVTELQYKGLDTVFPGYIDYNDHWMSAHAERYERVTESLRPASDHPRLFRSLYGLGCVTRAAAVRRGRMIGERVGIVPVSEHIYTLRCTDERPEPPDTPQDEPGLIGWTAQMFLKEFRP